MEGQAMAVKRIDGLETRRKLLQAATAAFARDGFHNARVTDICRSAGANVAAINYYFGGKEELYVAAWRHAFDRSIEDYPPDGGVPAEAPPEDRLRGQILALMHRIMDPASVDFDIAHREMANPTGLLGEVMRRSLEPLRRQFLGVIRELLGENVAEEAVQVCEMNVHAQCFAPLMRERHRKLASQKGLASGGPPSCVKMDVETWAEYISCFSLAGIRGVKDWHAARPGGRLVQKGKKIR
jgi:AcrR family transcriptional regulator